MRTKFTEGGLVTCLLWKVAKLCELSLLSDKRDVLDDGPLVKILSDEGCGHERWKLVGSAGEDWAAERREMGRVCGVVTYRLVLNSQTGLASNSNLKLQQSSYLTSRSESQQLAIS